MRVLLAPQYRMWMFTLFPPTLGLGTAALWLSSLSWPLRIDASWLTLRHHGRLAWQSITKIGVSRSYLDGHVAQLRIHHDGGVNKIPIHELQDGAEVARTIITMFAQARRAPACRVQHEQSVDATPVADRPQAGHESPAAPARRRPASPAASWQRDVKMPLQEFAGSDRRQGSRVLAETKEKWT
jgi:hypothetical protein